MSYLWEEYDKKQRFYVSTQGSSYMECQRGGGTDVSVNLNSRLHTFLLPESYVMQDVSKKGWLWDQYINDPRYGDVAHLLLTYKCQLERLLGLTSMELLCCLEERILLDGGYGASIQEEFSRLMEEDQDVLLHFLAKYNKGGQKDCYLLEALGGFFSDIQFHYEDATGIYHLYIHQEETEYHLNIYQICYDLFAPLTITIRVMWNGQCFAVIGEDRTMVIDEIVIF